MSAGPPLPVLDVLEAALAATERALADAHELDQREPYEIMRSEWPYSDDPRDVADALLVIADQLRFAIRRYRQIADDDPLRDERQAELPF